MPEMTNAWIALNAVLAAWPMFRGDQGLTGVTASRLPEALELRWTFKTGQAIKSSAAIAANRVFVGSDDSTLYALSAETGKPLWTFKAGQGIEASPLVLDGTVFVGSVDNYLYALDATNGALKWKYQTGDKILGAANWFRAGDVAHFRRQLRFQAPLRGRCDRQACGVRIRQLHQRRTRRGPSGGVRRL